MCLDLIQSMLLISRFYIADLCQNPMIKFVVDIFDPEPKRRFKKNIKFVDLR